MAAEVAGLTLLAPAINELSGPKTANPFVIPVMVAGFGFAPLPALAARNRSEAARIARAEGLALNLSTAGTSPAGS